MVTIKDENHIPELIDDLNYLQRARIKIGIFGKNDSKLLMIARVHEYGAKIKMTDKMRKFLFAKMRENGVTPDGSGSGDGYVNIPERSFVRKGYDTKEDEIFKEGVDVINKVLQRKLSARALLKVYGHQLAGMVQETLTNVKDPKLSELTIASKGSKNPLVNDGRLRQAITYKVELI